MTRLMIVETCYAFISVRGYEFRLRIDRLGFDGFRFDAGLVLSYDFLYLNGTEGEQRRQRTLFICKVHSLGQDVGLGKICKSVLKFERLTQARYPALGINVCGNLIIEATFKLAALTGQFLRIEAEVLATGRRSADALEGRNVVGTAQFPATYS